MRSFICRNRLNRISSPWNPLCPQEGCREKSIRTTGPLFDPIIWSMSQLPWGSLYSMPDLINHKGREKSNVSFGRSGPSFYHSSKARHCSNSTRLFVYWLNDIYHSRKHSSTGQTPFARFTSNMECLRESPANLKDYFRKNVRRRVAKDRTVSLNGRIFEAPVPLIGKQVSLLYHDQEPDRVEVSFEGRSYGLLTVLDIHVNCRVKRDKNNNIELESTSYPESYKGGSLWGKGENQ